MTDITYVVCVKPHAHPSFGDIPKGSRWFADDPIVKAAPGNFKKES